MYLTDLWVRDISAPSELASLYKIFEPLLGRKSIPFANKAEGKSRRKNYNLALGSSHLYCYYPGIQALSENLVHDWSSLAEMEQIPLNDSMITFGMKLAIVSMFGSDLCSDEAIKDIRHNFLLASNELERKLIGISDEESERVKTFEDARNRFHDHVNKLVTKRREHRKKTDATLLVDVLIDSTNDEEEILHDAVTFTAAGSHTTGSLLTWALYFLSTNPDVQENVYTEIDQVIGTSDVDPRSAKDLKYLHKVINETIRCAVIIPWTARYQDNDSELGGYKIPAKTSVIHALGASLQSEKYFLNPKRFDPDRFSEANIKSRPAYAFQPLGFAGKRMCPGYKLAIIGAIALLVNILKIFRVKLVEGQMVTPKFGIVTHPKDKIWITVEKR